MSPVGVLFDRTFAAFRARWRSLVGIMAVELFGRYCVMLASAAAVAFILLGGLDVAALASLPERLRNIDLLASRIGPLVLVLLAAVAALMVLEAWIVSALFYAAEHKEATLREALSHGWRHLVPCGVVMSLSTGLVLAGLFFFVVPGLVLSVLFLLAPNAYFAEGRTGWSALARARECVSGRFGDAAVRLGACWLAAAAGTALAANSGVPLVADAFGLIAAPWIVLYHSFVFRDLAESRGAA